MKNGTGNMVFGMWCHVVGKIR